MRLSTPGGQACAPDIYVFVCAGVGETVPTTSNGRLSYVLRESEYGLLAVFYIDVDKLIRATIRQEDAPAILGPGEQLRSAHILRQLTRTRPVGSHEKNGDKSILPAEERHASTVGREHRRPDACAFSRFGQLTLLPAMPVQVRYSISIAIG